MYYDQKESGKRIANLRKKEGLTQEQLAEKLSISYSLLAKVESGSRAASIDLLVEMKASAQPQPLFSFQGTGITQWG